MFYFWIEGHDMTVIEADGVSVLFYKTILLSFSVVSFCHIFI